MWRADYRADVLTHLEDKKVYRPITDIDKEKERMCKQLRRLVCTYQPPLGMSDQKFILKGLDMQEVPYFYILPKLHKMQQLSPPIIGRPDCCMPLVDNHKPVYVCG
jgi:hypothetical protein